jgi:hypothetical protein
MEGLEFEFWQGKDFSVLKVIQTDFWGLPSLLSNGYQGSFTVGKAARA